MFALWKTGQEFVRQATNIHLKQQNQSRPSRTQIGLQPKRLIKLRLQQNQNLETFQRGLDFKTFSITLRHSMSYTTTTICVPSISTTIWTEILREHAFRLNESRAIPCTLGSSTISMSRARGLSRFEALSKLSIPQKRRTNIQASSIRVIFHWRSGQERCMTLYTVSGPSNIHQDVVFMV
jgi:hypothetical protein